MNRLSLCVWALLALPLAAADDPKTKPPAGDQPAAVGQVRNVGVEQFDKLRADPKYVVLDVRTPNEFAQGHIPGAINIDYHSSDFAKKIGELDKNKSYLVHCAAGVRSAKACAYMQKARFKELLNLEPGFRAWEKSGKPVEKK